MTSCLQNRVKGFYRNPFVCDFKNTLYISSISCFWWPDLGVSAGNIPQVPNLRTKLPAKGKKGDKIYPQSWLIITFLILSDHSSFDPCV